MFSNNKKDLNKESTNRNIHGKFLEYLEIKQHNSKITHWSKEKLLEITKEY